MIPIFLYRDEIVHKEKGKFVQNMHSKFKSRSVQTFHVPLSVLLHWLQKVSEFEGLLVPGLEIKAFDRSQTEEAESWFSQ